MASDDSADSDFAEGGSEKESEGSENEVEDRKNSDRFYESDEYGNDRYESGGSDVSIESDIQEPPKIGMLHICGGETVPIFNRVLLHSKRMCRGWGNEKQILPKQAKSYCAG